MNVARLLQQDRPSIHYVSTLVQVMGASLLLLCAKAVGLSVGPLTLVAVLVVACYAVYGFLTLAWNVFGAFDPQRLCSAALTQFATQVRHATASGFRWRDPSFQNHYRKQAALDVEAMVSLMRMSAEKASLRRDSLVKMVAETSAYLTWYAGERRRIPVGSRWYDLVPQHSDWFLEDYTRIQMARSTCTDVTPKMVPHQYWVEDRLVDAIFGSIGKVVESGDSGIMAESAIPLAGWLRTLGCNLETDYAEGVLARLRVTAVSALQMEPERHGGGVAGVDIVHLLGYLHVEAVLGAFDIVRDNRLVAQLRNLSVGNLVGRVLYQGDVRPSVLKGLEDLVRRLEFERRVGGPARSPAWYVRQLAVSGYLQALKSQLAAMWNVTEGLARQLAVAPRVAKDPLLNASLAHVSLELMWKVDAGLRDAKALWESLGDVRVERGMPWAEIDWSEEEIRSKKLRRELIVRVADNLVILSRVPHDKSQPDLFGRSFEFVCAACFSALRGGDSGLFAEIFPPFLLAAAAAVERTATQVGHLDVAAQAAATLQPMVDAVELSGFAMVYAEIHDEPSLHEVAEKSWDKYLAGLREPTRVVKLIVQSLPWARMGVPVMPRSFLRAEWELALGKDLAQRGLVDPDFVPSYPPRKPGLPETKKVLRHLCRDGSLPSVDVGDYFIVSYLLRRREAEGVEFDDRWDVAAAFPSESAPEQ